jgi:hypothetical protein
LPVGKFSDHFSTASPLLAFPCPLRYRAAAFNPERRTLFGERYVEKTLNETMTVGEIIMGVAAIIVPIIFSIWYMNKSGGDVIIKAGDASESGDGGDVNIKAGDVREERNSMFKRG